MGKNNLKKLEKIKESVNPQSLGLILLILLTLAGIFYLGKSVYMSGFFRVVEVDSNVNIEPYIKNYIKGKSLLNLDIGKIYKTIARVHPEYKGVWVVKEFPSSVRINVALRKPFAQLHLKKYYLLDKERIVISANDTNCFPRAMLIEIENNEITFSKGTFVNDSRLGLAFKLIEEIRAHKFLNKFSINTINVTFPETSYFLIGNIHVVIGNDDFARKLYILENIFNERLRGDISSVEYIDLRYKNAYVGYRR